MNIEQIIIQTVIVNHLPLNFLHYYFIKFVDYFAVLSYDYPDKINYFIHLIKKLINLIPQFKIIEIRLLQDFDLFILRPYLLFF
jgi:hypothetical protein